MADGLIHLSDQVHAVCQSACPQHSVDVLLGDRYIAFPSVLRVDKDFIVVSVVELLDQSLYSHVLVFVLLITGHTSPVGSQSGLAG